MAYRVTGQGLELKGFAELNRALRRVEGGKNFGLEYELQKRLRTIGESVAQAAPRFVTHSTGRGHGELENSVKVSVTTRSASVYSTSVYGGAQNVGAKPKAGWAARGPHIKRANASKWMSRAVASKRDFVALEMDGVMDFVIEEFNRG